MAITREAYNNCIKPYITGTGKTKEERQQDFCIGAKICTGKASSRPEAEKICSEQPAKEPKPRKSRGRVGKSCSPESLEKVATCLATRVNFQATDMNKELRDNLSFCMCGKPEKKLSKAEQAVMSLDEGQRAALVQFMQEHGTTAGKKKDKILEKKPELSPEEKEAKMIEEAIKAASPEQKAKLAEYFKMVS